MNSLIRDGGVSLVGEVSMYIFVKAMVVVIIGRCVVRFVQVLGCVRIVFAVVWEWPKLCLSSCSSHHLQHLPLLNVSRHRHLLLAHVNFQAINSCADYICIYTRIQATADEMMNSYIYIYLYIYTMYFGDCSSNSLFASFTIHMHQKFHNLSKMKNPLIEEN
jgi:hypothetical protein